MEMKMLKLLFAFNNKPFILHRMEMKMLKLLFAFNNKPFILHRMEMKMLKTQIAVHKMDMRLKNEFKPLITSTPRQSAPAAEESPESTSHSCNLQLNRKYRAALDSFLLSENSFSKK